jgi:Retroviral aspartyl protease
LPDRFKFNYEPGPRGTVRPYLWLDLRVATRPPIPVRGVLDTGADVTLLDSAYLPTLGIASEELEAVALDTLSDRLSARRSSNVVWASLPGAPGSAAPLRPVFVDSGGEARWGRDFMTLYAVAFDEQAKQFSLYSRGLDPTPLHEP